jgi:hypothetical protein
MSKSKSEVLSESARELGRVGGRARARKYDSATLRKWARLGGRPRKAKGKAK